ncbi:MAG: hypothetical protein ACOZQL_31430 [Myxococcota bacterium]
MRALLILSVLSAVASAQGFELEKLSLNSGARETWLAQTGDGLAPLRLRASLLVGYQHRPLVYTVDGQAVGAFVGGRWTAHVLAAFALHEYLELGLQLPVVLAQSGDDLSSYGLVAPPSAALGAMRFSVRSTVLRQGERPFDLAVALSLSLPTGTPTALTKDPGVGLALTPTLGAGYSFGPVRLGLEAGVLIRGAQALSPASPSVSDEIGPAFTSALAVSTGTLAVPFKAELAPRVTVPFTAAPASVELLAAARYTLFEQLELSLLGGPGFGKTPGTPAFRVLFGASWTPDFSKKD